MQSCTLDSLINATDAFFEMHWSATHGRPPTWKCWDTFLYGSVPNYLHGGCYAILTDSNVVYVGIGASKGGGIYQERGISRRIMSHVIRSDRGRGPGWSKLTDTWQDATALHTIGFETAPYLAAALETYLIRTLQPSRNSRI